MDNIDFPIALASLIVQDLEWTMKQKSSDVIVQKTRDHIILYYLNGKDGLYKDFLD